MKLLLLLLISFYATTCHAGQNRYHLELSFHPDEQRMEGKARIDFPAGKQWQLFTAGLDIQKISVQEEGKAPFALPIPAGDTISMYGGRLAQRVTIVYSYRPGDRDHDNLISSSGIALTSGWHPLPDRDMLFSLAADLPPGFKGISESDTIDTKQEEGKFETSFSQALRTIHLAAGPYEILQETIAEGLSLSTWFFAEDADLARGYLDAAKTYILRYQEEIGPFPYKHYAIVANRLPSGFGMPTFTLLGQMVLRLPFIKETSLGHEILHSWFGNAIEVAEDSGNWCEGLTSYLADFSYAADRGNGVSHRKNSLINYQSHVHPDSAIALEHFRSASHNQPMAKGVRAVGYNRGAMFFHQLRGLLGPEDFSGGIRLFASSWQGRPAGWNEIKSAFETVSNRDLTQFFIQQLTRKETPSLTVTDAHIENSQDASTLHFTLLQNSEYPYDLQIPVRVQTMAGEETFTRTISELESRVSITLEQPPLSFSIDPDYDLFRELNSHEMIPVWSKFLGSEHILLVTDKGDAEHLAPFLKWAGQKGWTSIDSETVTNKQLTEHSVLFTNSENKAYQSLFGGATVKEDGLHLRVKNNPLNDKEVVVLLSSSSLQETKAALRKLSHYGKYSSLSFSQGKIQKKTAADSEDGLRTVLEELPMGGPSTMSSFDQVVTHLSTKRVIYLGETHDSAADHLLQLRVIQALESKGLELAVAMEMFPVSSQDALEEYVLDQELDEAEFLRQSHWFDVWRFDWRLFRPLFNFCRSKNIPVFGINVDKEIVSTVFASGHTDELSKKQQKTIAQARDLSLDGYVERLRTVHSFHAASPHGKGKGLSGFVQSQSIWDESMAENIVSILEDNPGKTVIVIAGSQHTRKDSGIPPRVLRRMDISQASVLNLYGSNSPADPASVADFFFMLEANSLAPKGKIGIILAPEKDEDEKEYLRITGISHAGKAGSAGIKENDIIIAIDGKPVTNMEDIGILMMDSRAGDSLLVTIQRTQEDKNRVEMEIKVELSDLTKPAGHP